VAVRLPPFWGEWPAVWFAQAKAQFSLVGIRSKTTKFFHVISQLDHWYAAKVEDIIISPPEWNPYTTLKTKLVRQLTPSKEQWIRQLLMIEEMGDRKPSSYGISGVSHLTCLKTSYSTSGPTGYPQHTSLPRLSTRAQLGLCSPLCGPHLRGHTPAGTRQRHPNCTPDIENLSLKVASLSTEQSHLQASSRDPPLSSRDPYSSSRDPRKPAPEIPTLAPGTATRTADPPPSRDDTAPTLCGYHRCFGTRVQKCTPPCTYLQQENYSSRHHRRNMSAPQQGSASSLLTDTVNGSS
jgi:hypothetical protein